jgi:LmbE family N-acetylglucosaminyl deacetylase
MITGALVTGSVAPLGIAALTVWLFTASIGAYMLRTWIARGGLRRQRATGVGAPPALAFGHPSAAVSGLAIWVGYLITGLDALAWVGVGLIATAIILGISMVTLWTPYPVRPTPEATAEAVYAGVSAPTRPDSTRAPEQEPHAAPGEDPDPFTVTDEMIARLLARPYPARRRRRLQLVPLIPALHGFAALATFVLAMVTAVRARLGTPTPDWAIRPLVGQAGIMAEELTMMAVHAHPDDEASSTGGVLAAYSAQGVRTVVVTCTNGEFGDGAGGVKPGQDGHDEQAVAGQRVAELRESCAILGVTDLELLGYHDSGMPEWDYKDRPDAFCNIPQAQVVARLTGLIERYRPQVLITYNDRSPYQHPDHLHASRCAQAAFASSGIPAKLYLSAIRESDWRQAWEALHEAGVEVPDFEETPEERRQADEEEHRITTTVDVRAVLERKRDALFAHGSQMSESSWFTKIPREVADSAFGFEHFIRAGDTTGAPLPEDDLFAGLRPPPDGAR